jgi:hypothetical protein
MFTSQEWQQYSLGEFAAIDVFGWVISGVWGGSRRGFCRPSDCQRRLSRHCLFVAWQNMSFNYQVKNALRSS